MDRNWDTSSESENGSTSLARSRQLLRRARQGLPTATELSLEGQTANEGPGDEEESLFGLVEQAADDIKRQLQVLEHACERLERVVKVLGEVGDLGSAAQRLEQMASQWDGRLGTTQDVWSRSAREVPRQVAEATAVVIRSVLAESRAWTTWTAMVGTVVLVVTLCGAFWSWRAYASTRAAMTAVEELAGTIAGKQGKMDRSSGGGRQ